MVVLMTDFGDKDPYVGIMKGVMLGMNPTLQIVDLTHGIPPQDTGEAAFVLKTSRAHFPQSSLFVAVVDPGVGTQRKIVYAETDRHSFLAPDNGILGPILEEDSPAKIIEVKNSEYFLKTVSRTFHARDIFAPVAARLASGLSPEELGPVLSKEDLSPSPFPKAHQDESGSWHGSVIYVDRFGNLVTNLWQDLLQLEGSENVEIRIKGEMVKGLAQSYSNKPNNEAVALLNSFNTVEIAVNRQNAARLLGVQKGDEVVLRCPMSSS